MKPGTIYRQYQCGHAIPVETKSYRVRKRLGPNKWTTLSLCPICRTDNAAYQYTFRECVDCGNVVKAAKGLSGERCGICGKKHREKYGATCHQPLRYYQAGERIPEPKTVVTEYWCRHRIDCLVEDPQGTIHCGGCPKFEREAYVLPCRHDPYEWAHGVAV